MKVLLLLCLVACRNDAITWAHAVLGPSAQCRAMHTWYSVRDVDTALCTFEGKPYYCEFGEQSMEPKNCRMIRNTYGLANNDDK